MKLDVQGREEIELTDPQGLCNPPVPPLQQVPGPSPFGPSPYTPRQPSRQPGLGEGGPSIYTRHVGNYPLGHPLLPGPLPASTDTKWGVGGEAIRRAGEQVDPEKWEKNWQSSEKGADGDGHAR